MEISQKELFGVFVRMSIQHEESFGPLKNSMKVNQYRPEEYLLEYGVYGELEEFTAAQLDLLMEEDDAEEALDSLISSLSVYLEQLEIVVKDFRSFKAMHEVVPEEDAPESVWQEHERHPRFRMPAVEHSRSVA